MNVLAFDPGGACGWAVGTNGNVIACGAADLAKRAKQLRCSKPTALFQFVREKIVEYEISAVCREDSVTSLKGFSRGGKSHLQALIVHSQYAAVIDAAAELKKVRLITPVNPKTLKAFATGNGNAQKPQMLAVARQLYRLDLRDDEEDAADACHVCAWAMQQVHVDSHRPGRHDLPNNTPGL